MNALNCSNRSTLPGRSHAAVGRRQVSRNVTVQAATPIKPELVKPFKAPTGEKKKVLCSDYGFRSGAGRLYTEEYGEVPDNVFALAAGNFSEEWRNMRRMFVKDGFSEIANNPDRNLFIKASRAVGGVAVRALASADKALVSAGVMQPISDFKKEEPTDEVSLKVKEQLARLTLDAHKVEAREKARFAADPPSAPLYIKVPYFALCIVLDLVYEGRPIQRFWVLEEVARMPYFAFISMLHLYESLGWWRAGAALRKVHFAEEWNELHHLQIMETLGGDQMWLDRFIAQHSAIVYFWFLIFFYAFSPKNAYQFSDLVEGHATDTYAEFVIQNEDLLKELPPPAVAVEYYMGEDVYMFESFMTTRDHIESPREPKCDSLYDVFVNIRDDEVEHRATMVACQNPQQIAKDIRESTRALALLSCDTPCSVDDL